MAIIILETKINAPAQRCFDLSRSVELHTDSTTGSNEKAIAGVVSGLMGYNDQVTWEAKHLGIKQHLTSKISKFDAPNIFVSEMVKGAFKKIYHQHIFKEENGITLMTDIFDFEAPLGTLGKIAEWLFLKSYMRRLLLQRNKIIQRVAESDEWEKYIFEVIK